MIPADKKPVSHRGDRTVAIIAREAAKFIASEASNDSLITVIKAISLSHGDRVIVFVSVFPEEKSRAALAFLERQRESFSDYLKEHERLSPLPRVDFQLDNGEASLPEKSIQ
jgi:ribosome-binding factor A